MTGLLLIALGGCCAAWSGAWFFALAGVILGVSCEVAAYRERRSLRERRRR